MHNAFFPKENVILSAAGSSSGRKASYKFSSSLFFKVNAATHIKKADWPSDQRSVTAAASKPHAIILPLPLSPQQQQQFRTSVTFTLLLDLCVVVVAGTPLPSVKLLSATAQSGLNNILFKKLCAQNIFLT